MYRNCNWDQRLPIRHLRPEAQLFPLLLLPTFYQTAKLSASTAAATVQKTESVQLFQHQRMISKPTASQLDINIKESKISTNGFEEDTPKTQD